MNNRLEEINELFYFLTEHKNNGKKIAAICQKLEKEISAEQARDNSLSGNEYLESLIELNNARLGYTLIENEHGRYQYSAMDFKAFMSRFIHIVKLHGVGVAQ